MAAIPGFDAPHRRGENMRRCQATRSCDKRAASVSPTLEEQLQQQVERTLSIIEWELS
jgi:hypothetical protein